MNTEPREGPFNEAFGDYQYVDTAIGGTDRRNNVMRVSEYEPGNRLDCFRTYCRFTEELKIDALGNVNPETGKPSVAGYPGDAVTDIVPFDFDQEGNLERALIDARGFVRRLDAYGINANLVGVFFSGHKGFSIDVPAEVFGGFEPRPDIGEMLKSLALDLAGDLPTLDKSIYQKIRLWRTPDTKHRKSGLYKVRLSILELYNLDLASIKGLAAAPRGGAA